MKRTQADPLKILQLVRGFDIGGLHGGAERYGLDLALELKKRGYEVGVSALFKTNSDTEKQWVHLLTDAGIRVEFLLKWNKHKLTYRYLGAIYSLGKRLRRDAVDICHSHYQVGSIAAIYLKWVKATSVAVRTAHITREWGEGFVAWCARRLFTDWLFPIFLDREVGVSEAILKILKKHAGSRLTGRTPVLIHNAVQFSESNAARVSKRYLPKIRGNISRFTIGSVGRLTRQKGYDVLLKAIPAIIAQIPARFILVGDGGLRDDLSSLADTLGIREAVIFTGQVTNIYDYYRQMDLFVLPSLWEGLPTVILEAMYAGVPVVATDIPGTNELIVPGWNGWLACPGDPHSLAETILLAARSPELCRRFVRHGKIEVKKYSLASVAGEYEVLYNSLTGSTEFPGPAG